MEKMQIRQANIEDLPQLLALYDHARIFMAEHGNPAQWGKNYPSEELVEGDIRNGNQYVGVADERIHRITSDGTVKGAASACLTWAFGQCGNLKIDTHRDNVVMQNMLQKNGFQSCGIIHVQDGSERLAYQKTK